MSIKCLRAIDENSPQSIQSGVCYNLGFLTIEAVAYFINGEKNIHKVACSSEVSSRMIWICHGREKSWQDRFKRLLAIWGEKFE